MLGANPEEPSSIGAGVIKKVNKSKKTHDL